jgi:hypothetical protein
VWLIYKLAVFLRMRIVKATERVSVRAVLLTLRFVVVRLGTSGNTGQTVRTISPRPAPDRTVNTPS